ncbi:MAG: DUF418 domain-containing protein [Fimbriimonadales bacterium]|nr:DUF418 domain-containing protein [Fimbriimonadales bacterium]
MPIAARLKAVDALRGVALLGILLVNLIHFKSPVQYGIGFSGQVHSLDGWALRLIGWLFEGKFYPIFSFLFGLGFALQMMRLEERGAPFVSIYVRRLVVLALIGVLHAVFIWSGDILLPYALLGFVLLLFRRCQPRTLLLWIGALWLFQFLCCSGLTGCITLSARMPEAASGFQQGEKEMVKEFTHQQERARRAYGEGNYLEAARYRVREWGTLLLIYLATFPNLLIMFLLGLYFGRLRVFELVADYRRGLTGVALVGLLLGLPLNWFYAQQVLTLAQQVRMDAIFLALWLMMSFGPLLSLGYIAAFLLLWERFEWMQRLLQPVAQAGRLALTNYLTQSLVCTLVFYGYGLGYYGKVGLAAGVGFALLLYLAQLVFSTFWLTRYQYGPAEWFWRSLTYGRLLPFSRSSVSGGESMS